MSAAMPAGSPGLKNHPENALPLKTRLGEYVVVSVLGCGGFGITYLAEDTKLGSRVAIKEYFPQSYAFRDGTGTINPRPDNTTVSDENYRWGMEEFLKEARALAKFKHNHIVRVLRFFEANGTAYMVMEYEEGESLGELLKKRGGFLDEPTLFSVFLPVLSGLQAVHEAGLLHLDIKPDNIYLRASGQPMLIDFGSSRRTKTKNKTAEKIAITPGYSAPEQYSAEGKLGPWTDVYAMGATLYRCITGKPPTDSMERLRSIEAEVDDPLVPAMALDRPYYTGYIRKVVDLAMSLDIKKRPRRARVMQDGLMGKKMNNREEEESKPGLRLRSGYVGVVSVGEREEEMRRGLFERLFMGGLALSLVIGISTFVAVQSGLVAGETVGGVISQVQTYVATRADTIGTEVRRVLRIKKAEPVTAQAPVPRPVVRTVTVLPFSPDKKVAVKLKGLRRPAAAAVFLGNGQTLLAASGNGVYSWRLRDGAAGASYTAAATRSVMAVSGDGRWLAQSQTGGKVKLRSLGRKPSELLVPGHGVNLVDVQFSPGTTVLAMLDENGGIRLWDRESKAERHAWLPEEKKALAIAFSSNGRLLATADEAGMIRYWSSENGAKRGEFKAHDKGIHRLQFSKDGLWLASAGEDGFLKLWSTKPNGRDRVLEGGPAEATSLTFTPDSQWLLVAGASGAVQLWNVDSPRPQSPLQGHSGVTTAVAVSADGSQLATADSAGQLLVWR